MIDLEQLAYDMHPALKTYSGIAQLIEANQDIPEDELVYPRMTYNFSGPYDPNGNIQSIIEKREVVPSDDPNFEEDIEFTYYSNPRVTLSVNAFGKDVSLYIGKARDWFRIPKLGRRFLEDYGVVIINITDTQDRKTFLETDYEDRQGFDVILQFEEVVKVKEKTIEKVEIETVNGTKIINL